MRAARRVLAKVGNRFVNSSSVSSLGRAIFCLRWLLSQSLEMGFCAILRWSSRSDCPSAFRRGRNALQSRNHVSTQGNYGAFCFCKTCDTPASPLRRSLRTHIVLFLHPDRHSPINFDVVVAKSHKTTQLVSTSKHTANANSSLNSQPLDFLPWPSTARAARRSLVADAYLSAARKMPASRIVLVRVAHDIACCYSLESLECSKKNLLTSYSRCAKGKLHQPPRYFCTMRTTPASFFETSTLLVS